MGYLAPSGPMLTQGQPHNSSVGLSPFFLEREYAPHLLGHGLAEQGSGTSATALVDTGQSSALRLRPEQLLWSVIGALLKGRCCGRFSGES